MEHANVNVRYLLVINILGRIFDRTMVEKLVGVLNRF